MKITKIYLKDRSFPSCTFCDRGALSDNRAALIYPYDYVYKISSQKNSVEQSICLCEDCFNKIKSYQNI